MAKVGALPKIWVFDIDDTLYLEREYVRSGFEAVGRHIQVSQGVSGFSTLAWKLFQEGVRLDTFNKVLAELGCGSDPKLIQELVHVYRNHKPEISLDPETYQLLTSLKSKRTITFLTGGHRPSQERKFNALRLTRIADAVVYAGTYGPDFDKPHPWAWREMEGITASKGTDLVYFGDNPRKDFTVPLQLNWLAIRIRLQGSEHFDQETPAGVEEVTNLHEAISYLL